MDQPGFVKMKFYAMKTIRKRVLQGQFGNGKPIVRALQVLLKQPRRKRLVVVSNEYLVPLVGQGPAGAAEAAQDEEAGGGQQRVVPSLGQGPAGVAEAAQEEEAGAGQQGVVSTLGQGPLQELLRQLRRKRLVMVSKE